MPDSRQFRPASSRAKAPESLGAYPLIRMRRNRSTQWVRDLVAENRLGVEGTDDCPASISDLNFWKEIFHNSRDVDFPQSRSDRPSQQGQWPRQNAAAVV